MVIKGEAHTTIKIIIFVPKIITIKIKISDNINGLNKS